MRADLELSFPSFRAYRYSADDVFIVHMHVQIEYTSIQYTEYVFSHLYYEEAYHLSTVKATTNFNHVHAVIVHLHTVCEMITDCSLSRMCFLKLNSWLVFTHKTYSI